MKKWKITVYNNSYYENLVRWFDPELPYFIFIRKGIRGFSFLLIWILIYYFYFPPYTPFFKERIYTQYLKNIFQKHRPNVQTSKFENHFSKRYTCNYLYNNNLYLFFYYYIYVWTVLFLLGHIWTAVFTVFGRFSIKSC